MKNFTEIRKRIREHVKTDRTETLYKCIMCGQSLLPEWVESDIDRNIAFFDENNKLYDVCVVCGAKLGLKNKQDLYDEFEDVIDYD